MKIFHNKTYLQGLIAHINCFKIVCSLWEADSKKLAMQASRSEFGFLAITFKMPSAINPSTGDAK